MTPESTATPRRDSDTVHGLVRCPLCNHEHPEQVPCSERIEHCLDCGKALRFLESYVHHHRRPLCYHCWRTAANDRLHGREGSEAE